jgi:hypothetical protein
VNWTTPSELKAQLARRWERGDLLRAWMRQKQAEPGFCADEAVRGGVDAEAQADVARSPTFPLALKFKGPSSSEVTARFSEVRDWVASLSALPHVRLTLRSFRHPVMGAQQLPEAIEVHSLEDALIWLGRRADAERLGQLLALTQARVPALTDWLNRSPLRALVLATVWPDLLSVVDWRVRHPEPGCYLRQVDLPGIHSKFIEAHRGVLAEMLDLVLPMDAVATEHSGVGRFAARYGFTDKPERIRLRVLDAGIATLPGVTCPDVALDVDSFVALALGPALRHVFITENEVNFLAFPEAPRAMVIFGAGYGWQALARAAWLHSCDIHYWGDIDTHGFAILDRLRARLPHARSLLMDHDTLMAHQALWGEEDSPVTTDLLHLRPSECALYDMLRDNRIRPRLRLEQEHIAYHCVEAAVSAAIEDR